MAINQKKVDVLVEKANKVSTLEKKIEKILDAKESVENRQAALVEIFSSENDLVEIKDGAVDNSKINALLTKFANNEYSGVMNVLAPAAVMYQSRFIVPDAAEVKKQYEELQVQLGATKEELESALFINENLRAAKQIYQEEYNKLLKENGNNKATADRLINAAVNKNQKYAERMQAITAVYEKRIADLEAQNNQDKNTAYKNGYASGQKHGKAKNWVIGGFALASVALAAGWITTSVIDNNTISEQATTIAGLETENAKLNDKLKKYGIAIEMVDALADTVCENSDKNSRDALYINIVEDGEAMDKIAYKDYTAFVKDANKDGVFDHNDFNVYTGEDSMFANFENKLNGIETFYVATQDLFKETAANLDKANESLKKYDGYTFANWEKALDGTTYSLDFFEKGDTVTNFLNYTYSVVQNLKAENAKQNVVSDVTPSEGVHPVTEEDDTSTNGQNKKDSEGNELGVTDDGELEYVGDEGEKTEDANVVSEENTQAQVVEDTTGEDKEVKEGKTKGPNVDDRELGAE